MGHFSQALVGLGIDVIWLPKAPNGALTTPSTSLHHVQERYWTETGRMPCSHSRWKDETKASDVFFVFFFFGGGGRLFVGEGVDQLC